MTSATLDFRRETADVEKPDEDFRAVKYFDARNRTEQPLRWRLERSGAVSLIGDVGLPAPLDLDAVNRQLEQCALAQGIDLAPLLDQAGEHLSEAKLGPRTAPLSEQEIELLIEDDRRSLDD